jgi:hypothetical protein
MVDCLPIAMKHHHARIFTALKRALRDQFPWEIVVIIA